MTSERPQWCKNTDCPNYPGYGPCRLKTSIIQNWPRRESRGRQLKRIEELAIQDPSEVRRQCIKSGS